MSSSSVSIHSFCVPFFSGPLIPHRHRRRVLKFTVCTHTYTVRMTGDTLLAKGQTAHGLRDTQIACVQVGVWLCETEQSRESIQADNNEYKIYKVFLLYVHNRSLNCMPTTHILLLLLCLTGQGRNLTQSELVGASSFTKNTLYSILISYCPISTLDGELHLLVHLAIRPPPPADPLRQLNTRSMKA